MKDKVNQAICTVIHLKSQIFRSESLKLDVS